MPRSSTPPSTPPEGDRDRGGAEQLELWALDVEEPGHHRAERDHLGVGEVHQPRR